jgi:hypothetical protein
VLLLRIADRLAHGSEDLQVPCDRAELAGPQLRLTDNTATAVIPHWRTVRVDAGGEPASARQLAAAAPRLTVGRQRDQPLHHHQPRPVRLRPCGAFAFQGAKPIMTINTTTILDPALPAWMREELLAQRARIMCRDERDLRDFVAACEEDLLARFATPEGRDADLAYRDDARDLLDVLEAWSDDLPGAWREVLSFAQAC